MATTPAGGELQVWNTREYYGPVLVLNARSLWRPKTWDYVEHLDQVDVSTSLRPGQFISGAIHRRLTISLTTTEGALARSQPGIEIREFVDSDLAALVLVDPRSRHPLAAEGLTEVKNEMTLDSEGTHTFTVDYDVQSIARVTSNWMPTRSFQHHGPAWRVPEPKPEPRLTIEPLPDTRRPPRRVVRRPR